MSGLWDWLSGKPTYTSRFDAMIRRHVVVHFNEGYTLDGVLAGLYADGVELEAAKFVRTDEYDTPLDGVQVIPWTAIAWVQELADARVGTGAPAA